MPLALALAPAAALAAEPADAAAEDGPWRAGRALGGPQWLHLSLQQRTRFERLWNDFRAKAPGDELALELRTLLAVELRFRRLFVGAEMQDSRLYLAAADDPINTTHVNPVELLQAHVGARLDDLLRRGSRARIRAGRMTLELGSRRLLARNRFRNTINAFTGLDAEWTDRSGAGLRAFVVLPLQRRPTAPDELVDNAVVFDREGAHALFWGLFSRSPDLGRDLRGELYLLGLHERDAGDVATRDRRLLTPGLRVHRQPRPGRIDLELEAAVQAGRSRASSSADDAAELRHLAFLVHADLGYTLAAPWRPRLVLRYDLASGDRDPDDDANNRFDTLYGARRFEHGPTGIYGAVARANINTPCVRAEARPHRTVDAYVAYRPLWLAAARDAWTTAGVRDATGASGSFVGHQLDARVRWRVLPGNVTLDVGFAHLFLGDAMTQKVLASGSAGDPSYVYAQVTLEI